MSATEQIYKKLGTMVRGYKGTKVQRRKGVRAEQEDRRQKTKDKSHKIKGKLISKFIPKEIIDYEN